MSNLKPTREEVDLSITDPFIHAATRCAFYAALAFSRSDGGAFAQGELLSDLAKLFSDFHRARNLRVESLQAEVIWLMQFSTEPIRLNPEDLRPSGEREKTHA